MELDTSTRTWGMAAHASALGAFVVGVPWLGPLIIYLAKRDDHPFIAAQAREALNFNLTVFVAELVIFMAMIAMVGTLAFVPFALGMMALVGVTIAWLVATVRGLSRAERGIDHRYRFTIRFVR
jgi:uncharacterized protein